LHVYLYMYTYILISAGARAVSASNGFDLCRSWSTILFKGEGEIKRFLQALLHKPRRPIHWRSLLIVDTPLIQVEKRGSVISNALRCVAAHCSVVQCVAVCYSLFCNGEEGLSHQQCAAMCCSVLWCIVICFGVRQCFCAVCYRVLQYIAAETRDAVVTTVLQCAVCDAVCCSVHCIVLHCVAVRFARCCCVFWICVRSL